MYRLLLAADGRYLFTSFTFYLLYLFNTFYWLRGVIAMITMALQRAGPSKPLNYVETIDSPGVFCMWHKDDLLAVWNGTSGFLSKISLARRNRPEMHTFELEKVPPSIGGSGRPDTFFASFYFIYFLRQVVLSKTPLSLLERTLFIHQAYALMRSLLTWIRISVLHLH